ncbi:hypothetical protein Q7C_2044 [Methylophaga frappieri]|jgi:ElaB/YqjD/DUF883 family membrane-anchored ribosome-binding protein|uniref:DUF883 domain-containing protein n=1 Tax=Methylophaga frappieri (strain ATCC BAA-2434 / DSM 25690 / JAM7) TaxID=754477 RepID=I1YJU0_METFJ|nr:DUF883 family protein [Methylophaga frappieri]AFJ03183.1 hypothetical protein Q7C_2044 [Methylophaga frappieri]
MATQTSNEELQKQLNALREDFAGLTNTLKQMSSAYAEQGQTKVKETAEKAQEQVKQSYSRVQGEVEANPMSSVAIAFGIGLVIGKILDR